MALFGRRRRRHRDDPAPPPVDAWTAMAARLDAWGCTPEEITRVEADQGVPLPVEYRRFLELMGRDGGGLLGGSDVCYPEARELREAAVDLLAEHDGAFQLPDDAAVFMMHQGYQFLYLCGTDPRVHWWMQGADAASAQSAVVADSLFDVLLADERSTALSPERHESHRRETATLRRMRFRPPEACPRCAGQLRWHTEMRWGPNAAEPGRARMIGTCKPCNEAFWRWADSPADELRHT